MEITLENILEYPEEEGDSYGLTDPTSSTERSTERVESENEEESMEIGFGEENYELKESDGTSHSSRMENEDNDSL